MHTRSSQISAALVLFASLAADGALPPVVYADDQDENVLESFKVEGNGDFLLIPVTIGGREQKFVLDTGTSVTAVDVGLKELGEPAEQTIVLFNGKRAEQLEVREATVGKTKMKLPSRLVCLDLAEFRRSSGHDIRGLLGMDFLSRHVIQLDFDGSRVSLLKKNTAHGEEIPIVLFYNYVPIVEATIAGAGDSLFVIDTGLSGFDGVLATETFDTVAKEGKFTGRTSGSTLTISGSAKVRVGTVSALQFGDIASRGLVFAEAEGKFNALGLGYLHRFTVTLDFPNRQLILAKGKQFDREDQDGLDIGAVIVSSANQRVVSEIEETGIGYKCGLRTGDRILEIDGRSTNALTVFQVQRLLRCARAGARLIVSHSSGAKKRSIVVRASP
jgi:hypothetical protein